MEITKQTKLFSIYQEVRVYKYWISKCFVLPEYHIVYFHILKKPTLYIILYYFYSSLSQRLLEICNLADIERKLDLYKAMFYHNTRSDRTSNFITSDSLKIELIAGGLNWKQQEYILEKMEPNDWGEVTWIDLYILSELNTVKVHY